MDTRNEVEQELQERLNTTSERFKELNCLLKISRLIEKRRASLKVILQGIVELIPPAFQYFDITAVKLVLNDQVYQTGNFIDTHRQLSQGIKLKNKPIGNLIVAYLEERPQHDEGPFLKEERNLINAIAERLGRVIERKKAQEDLLRSEKRFRDLVENSLTGISIVQNNKVIYQNEEQERLLGPLPRSFLFAELEKIHPDDVEKIKRLSRAIETGEVDKIETDFRFYAENDRQNNRSMKWVHCRALVVEFQGKKSLFVNIMDLTQAKKLEHLLNIQDKMASLGRVAAGMAHEIRNPLSGINIYLNTLKKLQGKAGSEKKQNLILDQIQSASQKIEAVIRRVMDFAKPSEPNLVLTDINQPLLEAIKLTVVTMRKRGIALEKSVADKLPPIPADKNLIEETVLNLLNNAAEAMRSMQKGKIIRVSSAMEKNHIAIRVCDSGPGIPMNIRDKIFEPYFTTKAEGTGIGLSLCNRIIMDHGGSITVSDGELGGAEFRIELPVKT